MTTAQDEAIETYLALLLDAGCTIRGKSLIFEKPYVWMTDKFGVWFLERVPDHYA